MSFLVLDIETVSDETAFVPLPPASTTRSKKDDDGDPFLPAYAHSVCAIGCLALRDDFGVQRLGCIMNRGDKGGEREALMSWSTYMAKATPTIVTWNGRGFDLPVLLARCFKFGVACDWYFGRKYDYRYSDADHCDLFDQMTFYGAARRNGYKLDAIARLIGLPGKPEGVGGEDVAALAAAGKWKTIEDYCLTDVVQTAFLFLRWKLLRGEIAAGKHDEAAQELYKASKELFGRTYPGKKIVAPLVAK